MAGMTQLPLSEPAIAAAIDAMRMAAEQANRTIIASTMRNEDNRVALAVHDMLAPVGGRLLWSSEWFDNEAVISGRVRDEGLAVRTNLIERRVVLAVAVAAAILVVEG